MNEEKQNMDPQAHKPIKKRKLLLLCNPGRETDGNYVPAVTSVLERYKNFFMSAVGGAWISSDVEEYNEIIEEPDGYDDEGEQTWLFMKIAEICRQADYSIIVFVGHGGAHDNMDYVELSKGKVIPISSFLAPEPFGANTKRTVIIDSCRSLIGAERQQLVLEQRSFSADGMLEGNLCRENYNIQIQDCEPHIELIQSTRYGDPAFVNRERTGTAFSDSVFRIFDESTPRWNEQALGVRNGQLSISMNSLIPEIQNGMQDYHQVPQYRRFGEGEGDYPLYSVWRPVERFQ